MKKFVFIFTGLAFIGIVIIAMINVKLNESSNLPKAFIANANAEALAREGLDTSYIRSEDDCSIYGNGKIKLVGGTIITVNGYLSIEGKVVCSSGGNSTCTPIECAQVWQWLTN
jgi:hypothetical protein